MAMEPRFVPQVGRIDAIEPESDDTRTFVIRLDGGSAAFDAARPGQFVMLSVFGHGEAAFTLSDLAVLGAPPGCAVITVRRVGSLTSALFGLRPGAAVGLRGPFGRGFPSDRPERPALYVGGGCGLSPLKTAIDAHAAALPARTRLAVLYGAREPAARIHRAALERWARTPAVTVIECVEHADEGWRGRRGVLAEFVAEALVACGAERAALCGPPAMLPEVARRLRDAGVAAADIHIAVERYMKCGTGHCGHCYIGARYVCRDGPVFSYAELRQCPEAFA